MRDLTRDALVAVLEVLPVGVMILRPVRSDGGQIEDFTCTFANAVLRGPRGLADIVGGRLSEQLPAEEAAQLLDRYVRAYEEHVDLDERIDLWAPSLPGHHYDVHARRVDDVLLVQVEDVTGEVDAHAAEEAAHRRVAETLERINDAVYALDADWCFSFVNAEAGRLLGREPSELVGQNLWESFPGTVDSIFERQYRHAVIYGETVAFEAYYPAPLDAWFSVRAYPGQDGLTVFFQNVDARHRVEERAVDLERLESTAMLARGASHQLSNLLMVIGGHAALLEESLPPQDPGLDDVRPIRSAAAEAAALTRQILAFGYSQEPSTGVIDLNAAVTGAASLQRQVLPPSVHLEVQPSADPVLVDVDADQLERALLHLATNSAHAMPQGGTLRVGVSVHHVDAEQSLAHPERAPGWYGVVVVADEGEGMAADVLDHALEPFFTTKHQEGATGLGLSAVHGVVRRSGGFVTLTSAPGAGTSVALHLPRSTADPAPGEPG